VASVCEEKTKVHNHGPRVLCVNSVRIVENLVRQGLFGTGTLLLLLLALPPGIIWGLKLHVEKVKIKLVI
jgi:hypothetical protein